ncbi:hypothetical protein MMC20_000407 [Loxospora ochrophaea]|nr:hypothetical protein [Loxospora ochrophaea]
MAPIPFKIFAYATAALICLISLVYFGLPQSLHQPLTTLSDYSPSALRKDVFSSIQNETLGFQKIFVLNMPERSDKRDSISLAASLTGIELNFVSGVNGSTVPTKALPKGQESRKMSDRTIGSWRAHMDAIRLIVEQNLGSALILEDDADWDVNVKSQLADFARGSRYLLGNSTDAATFSPYGDGWDLLWVGLCHDGIPKKDGEDKRVFVIEGDETSVVHKKLHMNNPEILENYPEHSRIVHMVGGPICTFGYALSRTGAQKVLYALSVKELKGIFDNALSWWCTGHTQDSKCISAQPTYFYQHRFAGGKGKSSDIHPNDPPKQKGETWNIRYSARLNMEKLMLGQTDYEDSYPDD